MDCSGLGISISNKSASPTPVLADNGTNQGEAINTWISLFISLEFSKISVVRTLGKGNYVLILAIALNHSSLSLEIFSHQIIIYLSVFFFFFPVGVNT